jgi:hypothetical protein
VRDVWLLMALATLLPGCKGDAGGTTSATPPVTTPVCQQTTILERASGLEANGYVYQTFSTSQTGRIDITVDWTIPASPISLYLVEEACTIDHLLSGGGCAALTFSQSGPKPRRASHFTGAGRYALIVINGGTAAESISMHVMLSSTGCPAITGTAPRGAS